MTDIGEGKTSGKYAAMARGQNLSKRMMPVKAKVTVHRAAHSHNASKVDLPGEEVKERKATTSLFKEDVESRSRDTRSRWVNIDVSAFGTSNRMIGDDVSRVTDESNIKIHQFEAAQTRGGRSREKNIKLNISAEDQQKLRARIVPDLKDIFSRRKVETMDAASRNDQSRDGPNNEMKRASKRNLNTILDKRDPPMLSSHFDLVDQENQVEGKLPQDSSIAVTKPWIIHNPTKDAGQGRDSRLQLSHKYDLNFRFLEQIKKANDLHSERARLKALMKVKGDQIIESLFHRKPSGAQLGSSGRDESLNSSKNSIRDLQTKLKNIHQHVRQSDKQLVTPEGGMRPNYEDQDTFKPSLKSVKPSGLLRKPPAGKSIPVKSKVEELSSIRARYSFLEE